MSWYLSVLKNYATFSGRARRKEYWMFVLFSFLISIVLSVVDSVLGSPGIIGGLYSLAVLCPSVAVSIRRMPRVPGSCQSGRRFGVTIKE